MSVLTVKGSPSSKLKVLRKVKHCKDPVSRVCVSLAVKPLSKTSRREDQTVQQEHNISRTTIPSYNSAVTAEQITKTRIPGIYTPRGRKKK